MPEKKLSDETKFTARQFLPNRHGYKTIKLKIIASLTTPKRHISKQIKKVQLDSIIEMANRTFNNH